MRKPIGWSQYAPKRCFFIFSKGWGVEFPSSSQRIPIKFLLFPSITHQNLVCSHQVPKYFASNPFVSIKFPWTSFCSQTQPYINPHKAWNFGIKSFFCNLHHCISFPFFKDHTTWHVPLLHLLDYSSFSIWFLNYPLWMFFKINIVYSIFSMLIALYLRIRGHLHTSDRGNPNKRHSMMWLSVMYCL